MKKKKTVIEAKKKPKFKHDCDTCIFLGRYSEYDVYIHVHVEEGLLGTILLRYGDKGSHYYSMGLDMLLGGYK